LGIEIAGQVTVVQRFFRSLLSAGFLLPLGLGLNFLMNVVLARAMPVAGFGLFSYVLTLASILALGSSFGFSTSMMRFIPEYQTKNKLDLLLGLIYKSFKIVLIGSLLISLGILVLEWLLPIEGYSRCFAYTALLIIPLAIDVWRESSMRGLHQVARAILPRQVLLPLVILCLSLLLGLKSENTLLFTYFLSLIVLEIVGLWQLWQYLPVELKCQSPAYKTKYWLTVSAPMGFAALVRLGINRWDVLLVGIYLGMEVAGTYTAAARLSLLISLAMRVISLVCGPMLAQAYHSGRAEELRLIMNLSVLLGGIIGTILLILVFLFPNDILLLFGKDYQQAAMALRILAIGQFINLATGPASLILLMTGYEKLDYKLAVFSGTLSLLLGVILIPICGINGAALATTGAVSLGNLGAYIVARRLILKPHFKPHHATSE
jgi:O-antigen/teichoic acid export membrane protein